MTNTTYKQTAIGLIPSDWEVKKFNKVAKFYSGGTPLTSKKEYYNGIIPFIKSGEIYFDRTEQFISEEGLSNSSAKMVKTGDLLYALYGANSGEIAICKISGAINQAILCIQTEIDKIFIYNFLLNEKQTIISKYLQGGQGNLSAEIIKNLQIPLPPLPEQQKIVAILSTWDVAIDNCKAIIEKLKVRNKGLAQQLLTGKMRVKGFENSKWETLKLGEVFKLSSGNTKPKEFGNQDKLFLYPVYGGNGIIHYAKEYLEEGEKIIIGRVGEYCGNTQKVSGKYWITDNALYSVKFLIKVNIDFLTFKLKYEDLSKLRSIGGQPQVSQQPIYAYKITVPTFEEQKAIANILDKATQELNQYEQKLQNLQLQKKGLMQQLLTGKVRVRI